MSCLTYSVQSISPPLSCATTKPSKRHFHKQVRTSINLHQEWPDLVHLDFTSLFPFHRYLKSSCRLKTWTWWLRSPNPGTLFTMFISLSFWIREFDLLVFRFGCIMRIKDTCCMNISGRGFNSVECWALMKSLGVFRIFTIDKMLSE